MQPTRVLVVDDEETIRGMIVRVLKGDGYDVAEATSAEEALKLYRGETFPLVMTDIYMGEMSGLDLLQEIKTLDAETVVVVMTSNASLETATAALRAGAYDYLVKPFEEIKLISAVVNRAVDRFHLASHNRALMEHMRQSAVELERVNATLTDMANRDALTGLYNHRYFREAIDREISRAQRHDRVFSLLFIDIDYFKCYNDSHGHLAGDEVLRELATIFREKARKTSVVARYGGEEFVLLIPETGPGGAQVLAEKLRDSVESHPFVGRESQPLGKLTLSIGVASFPESGRDCTELIDRADKALYRAKGSGRNQVCVWEPERT